jgi:hypothetical protein
LTILMGAFTFSTTYVITIIIFAIGGKISNQMHSMSCILHYIVIKKLYSVFFNCSVFTHSSFLQHTEV